ncbi:MAG: hypothetical protein M0R46_10460 [Candidatus Muirbacterium halophilum]|nr:hypothetical protein [Candidatus Muirbacterium halophilum]
MNKEIIIIVGKTGSGKSFLFNKFIEKGFIGSVKYTTRPIRKFEVDGVSYNFTNLEKFNEMVANNDFFVYESFKVSPKDKDDEIWYYGILKSDFNDCGVFIMTPGEVAKLNKSIRDKSYIVYLDIPRDIRENRLNRRNDVNDNIKRRMDSDDKDFEYFIDYDLSVIDPDFTMEDIYEQLKKES